MDQVQLGKRPLTLIKRPYWQLFLSCNDSPGGFRSRGFIQVPYNTEESQTLESASLFMSASQ